MLKIGQVFDYDHRVTTDLEGSYNSTEYVDRTGIIQCPEKLGGMLRYYYRDAA